MLTIWSQHFRRSWTSGRTYTNWMMMRWSWWPGIISGVRAAWSVGLIKWTNSESKLVFSMIRSMRKTQTSIAHSRKTTQIMIAWYAMKILPKIRHWSVNTHFVTNVGSNIFKLKLEMESTCVKRIACNLAAMFKSPTLFLKNIWAKIKKLCQGTGEILWSNTVRMEALLNGAHTKDVKIAFSCRVSPKAQLQSAPVAMKLVWSVSERAMLQQFVTSSKSGKTSHQPSQKTSLGSWQTPRDVPNAIKISRKIKVATICTVHHASMTFVGCAWVPGKNTAPQPVATTSAISMTMQWKKIATWQQPRINRKLRRTNCSDICGTTSDTKIITKLKHLHIN